MKRFQRIEFEHNGESFYVEASQVMGLIDVVEEHITLGEIVLDQSRRRTVRFGKLAQAYAAALRYAGAKVTDEEVYVSLMPNGDDPTSMQRRSTEVITALLQLMVPPDEALEGKDLGKGDQAPGGVEG